MIVDSHCHVGSIWYEPAEALLFQMDRCGVAKAVLIQMLGQYDNRYQQTCAARWPDRFVSVGAVDSAAVDALDQVRALAEGGARGLRLRPTARSSGDDPLLIWRAAADLGLAISCVGTTAQFTDPSFADLAGALPQLTIVLEHLGGIARPDADDSTPRVWDLARLPNLHLKVPGLGQLAKRSAALAGGVALEPGGEAAIVRAAQAFSPSRLMWGSDFPVVSSREGYANALTWARDALNGHSAADAAEVFGLTANRVFGIR